MAIRKSGDWLCARVGDEVMMMSASQGSYIGLDTTGARIWDQSSHYRTPALATALAGRSRKGA